MHVSNFYINSGSWDIFSSLLLYQSLGGSFSSQITFMQFISWQFSCMLPFSYLLLLKKNFKSRNIYTFHLFSGVYLPPLFYYISICFWGRSHLVVLRAYFLLYNQVLMGLMGPYVVPEIEPMSSMCKISILPAVQCLQTLLWYISCMCPTLEKGLHGGGGIVFGAIHPPPPHRLQ